MAQITPYSSMISLRSRRLRTLGIALLVVLLLLTGYGILALMPAMKSATMRYSVETHKINARKIAAPEESAQTLRRMKRLMVMKWLFVDAYWLTCGLVAFSAMFVAWLDFREVSRQYIQERRSLWNSAGAIPPDEASRRDV